MPLTEEPPVTVTVGAGTVTFPRFVFRRGQTMTAEQAEREAAAFAEASRLMGHSAPGQRTPGDDDGEEWPDTRTREQREQDTDFEAEAVKIVAGIEAKRRRGET